MAILGNNTTPSSGVFWYGLNTNNAAWSLVTTPVGGGILISSISAYFDTEINGSATCYVCVWDGNNGTLLASVAIGGIPQGNNVAGQQAWHTGNLGTSLYVAGNKPLALGFWSPQNNGFVTSTESTGGSYSGTQSGSGPGTASGPSTGYGALGAYVNYTLLPAPTVSGDTPSHGIAGDTVVISGSNFSQISSVTFNGTAASFTVNSTTQITATVPSGAASGNLTVTNPAGSSSVTFVVSTTEAYSGSAFVALDTYCFDGTTWQLIEVMCFDGTTWQEIG